LPAETPPHRLHQLGFSLIGQCVFYRFHQRIVALMISPDERTEHFQLESLGRHIYSVMRAAIDRLANEFGDECPETVRKSREQ
jgi:hypothetical protein